MTKIWRETGFVENDPWVIETDEVKATEEQKPLLLHPFHRPGDRI